MSSSSSSSPSPLSTGATLPPGFRFHPTDEELIMHYLRKRISAAPCPVPVIADVDIYKFDPWDLPAKAVFGDREWYFFTPRDRKYPNGVRPNRSAASGYWKATGTDKPIQVLLGNVGIECTIGVKKALVFYVGKPPRGMKTNWIMHEYRLADVQQQRAGGRNRLAARTRDPSSVNMRLDDWVLCRIFMKAVPVPPAVFSPQPPDLQQDIPAPPAANMMNMHEPSFQLSNAPVGASVSDFLENNLVLSDMLEAVPEPDLPPMVPDQAQLNEAAGLIEQYMQMSGEESYLTGGSGSSIATSEGIGYMGEIINGHNAMLQESADENSLLLDDASMPMTMNSCSDEFDDGFTQSLLMDHDFFGSQL